MCINEYNGQLWSDQARTRQSPQVLIDKMISLILNVREIVSMNGIKRVVCTPRIQAEAILKLEVKSFKGKTTLKPYNWRLTI